MKPLNLEPKCNCCIQEDEFEINPLFDDEISYLGGLPRKCPKCGLVFQCEVKGRKEIEVECPECDHKFLVKKYRRGERPKCKFIKEY